MNYQKHPLILLVCVFLFTVLQANAQLTAPRKIKVVKKKPYVYEFPTITPSDDKKILEEAWVVYSDRKDNIVYSDKTLSRAVAKVQFLDSFFVARYTDQALELIKFNTAILQSVNKITDPLKVEYIGWIKRTNLILNDNSYIEGDTKKPYKFISILNGNNIFNQYKKSIKPSRNISICTDPDLINETTEELAFNQVVYVYKKLKSKVLIGKNPSFSTADASTSILGWVPETFIQNWGTGLLVKPIKGSEKDTLQNLLFSTKNEAFTYKQKQGIRTPYRTELCIADFPGSYAPVISAGNYKINGERFKILQTGKIINPFSFRNAYVVNVNGGKIGYQELCNLAEKARKINIVFVMNIGNDSKEYMSVFLQTMQELGHYFKEQKQGVEIKFGLYDCTASKPTSQDLKTSYEEILPEMINLAKEKLKENKPSSPEGILTGLSNAGKIFKNHEKETNIIVLVSSTGDENHTQQVYRNKMKNLSETLAYTDAHLLFFQPYSANTETYASFVTQSKQLLEQISQQATVKNKVWQVGNNARRIYSHSFRTVQTGAVNIYCLDYPKNSDNQGYIIFPTVGNKTDSKYLTQTIDSLLAQLEYENKQIFKSIETVFNSPAVFNAHLNKEFEECYGKNNKIPDNPEIWTGYYNFNYFYPGYSMCPNNYKSYYQQCLLLSKEEYEEIFRLFKSLRFDLLAENQSQNNRNLCYNALTNALSNYSVKQGKELTGVGTLDAFFAATCGYQPANYVMKKFNLSYLPYEMKIKNEYFVEMVKEINRKMNLFYSINNNPRFVYQSNGNTYYLIPDEFLP